MKIESIRPVFVEFIPEVLEEGILYLSLEFSTTTHLCYCGCKEKVVLPINPTQWTLTMDKELISLSPSIGSWSLKCKSHYYITNNRVIWL